MKIYKIAFRNLTDMDANKLGTHIFGIVKSSIESKSFENSQFIINPFDVVDKNSTSIEQPLKIIVNLSYIPPDPSYKFSLGAAYSANTDRDLYFKDPISYKSTDRIIDVGLTFCTDISNAQYNSIYLNLIDAIRHELQHMVDDDKNIPMTTQDYQQDNPEELYSMEPSISFNKYAEYILSRMEQKAYVRALMLKAKKMHVPIEDLIKEVLRRELFKGSAIYERKTRNYYGNSFVNNKVDLIFNTLMDHAIKTFPNLNK